MGSPPSPSDVLLLLKYLHLSWCKSLSLAWLHALPDCASISNATHRMTDTDIHTISVMLQLRAPCNMLVFDLSPKSSLWLALNHDRRMARTVRTKECHPVQNMLFFECNAYLRACFHRRAVVASLGPVMWMESWLEHARMATTSSVRCPDSMAMMSLGDALVAVRVMGMMGLGNELVVRRLVPR
jgi:hypothetical protein